MLDEVGAADTPLPPFWRANAPTLLAGAAAVVLAAVVWFVLPHEREVSSVGMLLFKTTPFLAAALAIATLDLRWAERLRMPLWALPALFLLVFCYFIPRMFFYSGSDETFEQMYYTVLTMIPVIILGLVLAFRLGGGSSSRVLRLAVALLLLMLSGLEDLAFLLVNPHTDPRWTPIPETWTWASHINVFFGRAATKEEAFAFIAVHVLLAVVVLTLPGTVARRAWARVRPSRNAQPRSDTTARATSRA